MYTHYQLVWYKTMYKNERGGERGQFVLWEEKPNFLFQHLQNSVFLLVRKGLSLNPNLSRHIYRASLGNEERETLTKLIPSHSRNFHAQKLLFWCFPDYTQYLINCVIKREYYLSFFVMKNSATLVQVCCRIFLKGKSTIWLAYMVPWIIHLQYYHI